MILIPLILALGPLPLADWREAIHALAVDVAALCASICFLASLLLRAIPTPLKIQTRWYRKLYNILRWLALNNAWKVRR